MSTPKLNSSTSHRRGIEYRAAARSADTQSSGDASPTVPAVVPALIAYMADAPAPSPAAPAPKDHTISDAPLSEIIFLVIFVFSALT